MTQIASTPPGAIRARIHDSAIRRVTRIYASTLSDVMTEALQNSRRADAAQVRIAVATLADPAVLLSFGENGWSDDLVRREDAAGFGFASLSRRGCTVSSRPRSPDGQTQPGWRVDLAPEHFLGESARAWYREACLDHEWYDFVFEDFETICQILGIALRTSPVKLMGGGTREKPHVFFAGFSSQGDGASFEGQYSHARGAAKGIRAHAPQDTELHRIADALQEAQRRNFVTAQVVHGDDSGFGEPLPSRLTRT